MPLLEQLRDRGAYLSEDGDILHFGDPSHEWRTACERYVLNVLSNRSLFELTGDDAVRWFQNFCTQDVSKLEPGQGTEAFCVDVKARILGHVTVLRTESGLLLESHPEATTVLHPHLDRYIITEDVTITDRTPSSTALLFSGPQTSEIVRERFGCDLSTLPHLGHMVVSLGGADSSGRLVRVDWTTDPAALLLLDDTSTLDNHQWESLLDSTPLAGDLVWEHLRIGQGFPIAGQDLDEKMLAPEANRDERAICYTKGCYLGQEPIARIDAIGHVNRKLVRLAGMTASAPSLDAELRDDDGQPLRGRLTSVSRIDSEFPTVALAIVPASHATQGTRIGLGDGSDSLSVQ